MLPDSDHEPHSPIAQRVELITFFNPDRPVENGTVNVLPEAVVVTRRHADGELIAGS